MGSEAENESLQELALAGAGCAGHENMRSVFDEVEVVLPAFRYANRNG